MKYWCFLFFSILFIQVSCQVAEQNIYDYYQSLPESFFYDADLGENKYVIQKKEGVWICKSTSGNNFSPLIDLKNGYIEINDEGTGGGNSYQQIVLFRKIDRSPLIGVTTGSFNGFYFDSSTTFYEKLGNKWMEAKNVFPELTIQRFLNPTYRKHGFTKNDIVSPNLTTLTVLPQHGTTVKVELNFNKYDYLIESNQNVYKKQSFSKKEAKQLWERIENISIESFQLKFNKTDGKFEVIDSTFLSRAEIEAVVSVEESVLNQVWELNEVKELAAYIDTESNTKRNLKLIFEEKVDNKPDFYMVRAVEDNGGNFVTHLTFHVKKDGSEVYLYDAIEDAFKKIDH